MRKWKRKREKESDRRPEQVRSQAGSADREGQKELEKRKKKPGTKAVPSKNR